MCALAVSAQGLNTQASKDDWEEINFEFNSAVLSDGFPSLLRLSDLLSKHSGYRVKIEGHTDNLGGDRYNQKLGLQRANTVRDFLVKYGAKPEQIEVASRGENTPETHGYKKHYSKTDVARWMNRRVVLTVTDEQGKVIAAGGPGDAIKAMGDVGQCCADILKRLDRLDEIAQMLKDMAAQNSNLKQQVADLQQKQGDLEKEIHGAPKPLTAAQTANVVDTRLEQFRDKRYTNLGINLGSDTFNKDITFSWSGRYFAPFKDHFAFQAQGEYMYFHDWREGQFDFGLVNRIDRLQAGVFASFKHVNLRDAQNGGTLGQAALTVDYLFNRGKIGFFGTKAFLDNAVIDRNNYTFQTTDQAGATVLRTAPNVFVERYLHAIDQIGASGTIALWGNNYFEANAGVLRTIGYGNRGGGSGKFVFPIANRLAITLAGGVNETYVTKDNWGRIVAGIEFGNFLRPKDYATVDHPVPVDIPRVRWEVLSRLKRDGVAPPVADAGADQIGVAAGHITLNGSASYDPNGEALTYHWIQEGGSSVALSGANASVASFQAAAASTYAFRLTVTNTSGLSASARVRVTTAGSTAAAQVTSCTAVPMTITQGQTATLYYQTQNASSVSISGGVGSVALNGSAPVTPQATTTYVVTAVGTNGGASATCQVAVQVTPAQAPQILRFTATPSTINAGQTSTLLWQVTNADTVSITSLGNVATTGNNDVSPTQTTTYTLTATNKTGSVTASATVTVNTNTVVIPSIKSFTASPNPSPAPGSPITLTCLTENATKVTIAGVGEVGEAGTATVSPNTTTTYTCIASNNGRGVQRTVTVTVGPGNNPTGPVITVQGGPVINMYSPEIVIDLTGTTSPQGNYPLKYAVSSVGNTANILNPSSATPDIVVPQVRQDHQIMIVVTDSKGVASQYLLTLRYLGPVNDPFPTGITTGGKRTKN